MNCAYLNSLQTKISNLGNKFAQKLYFRSKTEKSEYHHWILHIELVYVRNFSLNRQSWILGQNLPKKSISNWKQKKVNITNEFCIFELVQVPYYEVWDQIYQ